MRGSILSAPHKFDDSSSLGAQQALFLALPFTLFFRFALVMLFFAFGEPDFKFDFSARVMYIKRHQRVTGALHFADQPVDFLGAQQQFAGTRGIGHNMG